MLTKRHANGDKPFASRAPNSIQRTTLRHEERPGTKAGSSTTVTATPSCQLMLRPPSY